MIVVISYYQSFLKNHFPSHHE